MNTIPGYARGELSPQAPVIVFKSIHREQLLIFSVRVSGNKKGRSNVFERPEWASDIEQSVALQRCAECCQLGVGQRCQRQANFATISPQQLHRCFDRNWVR